MQASRHQSLSDYYRLTYIEWRMAYGLSDCCMNELVAAMRVEVDHPGIERQDALRLRKLIMMIEAELHLAQILLVDQAA